MNEEQYNSLIKKQLEENEDTFFSDIEHSKNRTWNLIEHRLEKKKIIPLWFYYAAAFLILLFGISFLFRYEIKNKNTELALLNKKITDLENNISDKTIKIIEKPDTVKLISKQIMYVQTIKHDTILMFDTINQLITKTDTVFIKEELPELIAENEIAKTNNIINNELTSSNKINKKKKKNKRFTFRFGTPRNNYDNTVKETSLLSLKTEF